VSRDQEIGRLSRGRRDGTGP